MSFSIILYAYLYFTLMIASEEHVIDLSCTTMSVSKDITLNGDVVTSQGTNYSKNNCRYSPMGQPSFFSLTSLPASADLVGYRASFSDSVWMYLVPNKTSPTVLSGKIVRVLLKSLTDTNDFATNVPVVERLDLSVYNSGVDRVFLGFSSGTTDNKYAYFVTGYNSGFSTYGFLVRVPVDIEWTPAISASVQYLNLAVLSATLKGFSGCVYDGTYIYLIPSNNGSAVLSGNCARVNPATANWTAVSSIQGSPLTGVTTLDLRATDPKLCGFYGGVITASHVYFVPYYNGVYSGKIARVPVSSFLLSSIETLDLASVSSILTGYRGGVYDGRYIYLAPYYNNRDPINYPGQLPDYHGKVVRIDAELFSLESVVHIDLQSVNTNLKGFEGLSLNTSGKYLYLCPNQNLTSGLVARIDVSRFTNAGTVSTSDLTAIHGGAVGYSSGVSFREFVLLAPTGTANGYITRYNSP